MGATVWFEVSGYGEQLLSAGANVAPSFIIAHLGDNTSPKVRVFEGGDPRRIMYAGSVGLGGHDEDHTSTDVTEYAAPYNLVFERQVIPIQAIASGSAGWCDRIYWRIPLGVTWWLLVAWL